jgi:hypothetical protein
VAVDLIGKYLRLRRELLASGSLKPGSLSLEQASRRRRLAQEVICAGAELEAGKPEEVPSLETMPWSDNVGVSYEHLGRDGMT